MFHRHQWQIRKYGVRAYESGRHHTVVFLVCQSCPATRTKVVSRKWLSADHVNAYALKKFHQTTSFTGHGSDRPAGT